MAVDKIKLQSMILFFANHVTKIGTTKLNKLIYFADAWHLREYGSSISDSEYIKYEFGPVPSKKDSVIRKLRKEGKLNQTRKTLSGKYELHEHEALVKADLSLFSPLEISTLTQVCEQLGMKTAKELSEMSHSEPAWICAPHLQKLSPELMMYGPEEDPDGL